MPFVNFTKYKNRSNRKLVEGLKLSKYISWKSNKQRNQNPIIIKYYFFVHVSSP